MLGGLLAAALLSGQKPPARPALNLLPNSGFEEIDGDGPRAWRPAQWGGRGEFARVSSGRTGACLCITSTEGADVAWSCSVPVELRSRYRLAGWIRTQDVATKGGAKGALLNVHNVQPVQTPAVVGTRDWTRVEVEFDTGMEETVAINCLFGGWGLATGTAFYDDVELVLLHKGEVPAPSIAIDVSQVGTPISKYIYGQFIEHLGRCIYGGIWAEVIEDRKFFHAVGEAQSPWRVIGGTVAMDATAPFVGGQSPRLTANGGGQGGGQRAGIGQTITLRAGVDYVGHVWLAGESAAAPVVIGVPGNTTTVRELAAEWARVDVRLRALPSAGPVTFEIAALGRGTWRIGAVSLMPADQVQGLRSDTLALLRELDSPVYRWPGGNFVSGYDWRDGIGDRDRRPARKNPAWTGIESNDVGVDEFMTLCKLLGTEAAADELQYLNGPAASKEGLHRAVNGHSKPYGVKFWGIGNEMYGDWQLGNVPLAEYTKRHNAFVDAMRGEDPSIQVVGVGAVGMWSETMLRHCADRLDFLSEHVYWQERQGLLSHVKQAPESLRRIAQAHRGYRKSLPSLAGRDIRLVQDEWNYWYGPHVFGELGTRYFMKDALGVAAALHEFVRHSDLFFMANYAQTVNVIGAIKTTPTAAWLETTGLVLKLYRKEFGTLPVKTECGPTLDAMAALSADRKTLTLGVVNPTLARIEVPLAIIGAKLSPNFVWRTIAADPAAYNDAAQPTRVRLPGFAALLTADKPDDLTPERLRVEPSSVTIFRFDVR